MSKRSILLVEDNDEDRTLMMLALKDAKLPFHVEMARDGEEAWKSIRRLAPSNLDGMILDLNIPKISGLELLKRVRDSKTLSSLRVVVLTSSDDPNDMATANSLGVSAYFIKPLDFGGLESIVKRLGEIFAKDTKPGSRRIRS